MSSNEVFSPTFSSRETKDYRDRGVSQENQGVPEEMWVFYNIIIIHTSCSLFCFVLFSGFSGTKYVCEIHSYCHWKFLLWLQGTMGNPGDAGPRGESGIPGPKVGKNLSCSSLSSCNIR